MIALTIAACAIALAACGVAWRNRCVACALAREKRDAARKRHLAAKHARACREAQWVALRDQTTAALRASIPGQGA